ncbi:sirohydrochlorin chelatase [Arcobacter sp. YIC-464]|uniref:sirohydrochlorin chelatase n=1 Tax=Arcobacter sp. YIC-464 TaxID=3376631 RepID=UPI003C25F330
MDTLLVIAHGSRVKDSNEEIIKFCESIKSLIDDDFEVKYAFLELAEPNIYDSLESCLKNNLDSKIKILPYFLARGKHVKVDIPMEIEKIKEVYNNANIEILPHLGKIDGLAQLIINNYCLNKK